MDYEYIKNHYIVPALDLSGQKQLDTDLKVIQQIELVEQLQQLDNNGNAADDNANGNDNITRADQSMFVLTILEKNQKDETIGFLRKFNSLTKDGKWWRSKS